MNIAPLIQDLLEALTPEAYARNKQHLDKLADAIIVEEKDLHYRQHPEECRGA